MLHVKRPDIVPENLRHAHLQGSREVLPCHLLESFEETRIAEGALRRAPRSEIYTLLGMAPAACGP